MDITIIGAGPAGLFAALQLVARIADARVTVLEQRTREDRPGLGITLPSYAVAMAVDGDPDAGLLRSLSRPWNRAEIYVNGQCFGFPFAQLAGVARAHLVGYLEARCEAVGVGLRHDVHLEAKDVEAMADSCDLLIGADGQRSVVRGHFREALGATVEDGRNHYIWLAADRAFPEMRVAFQETEHGVLLCSSYPYSSDRSTVIVECSPEAFRSLALAGVDGSDHELTESGLRRLEDWFAPLLQGARLLSGRARWRHFRCVRTRQLHVANVALVGDAGATMYYSFGAGTPMALRCAGTLASILGEHPDPARALPLYEQACRPPIAQTQRAAELDMRAMQKLDGLMPINPAPFAHAYVRRFDRLPPT